MFPTQCFWSVPSTVACRLPVSVLEQGCSEKENEKQSKTKKTHCQLTADSVLTNKAMGCPEDPDQFHTISTSCEESSWLWSPFYSHALKRKRRRRRTNKNPRLYITTKNCLFPVYTSDHCYFIPTPASLCCSWLLEKSHPNNNGAWFLTAPNPEQTPASFGPVSF